MTLALGALALVQADAFSPGSDGPSSREVVAAPGGNDLGWG
ncbi:hypothetical protein [Streptomyces davaonensis]|nr:hypothetical protein [Streptomyces davaonensis]